MIKERIYDNDELHVENNHVWEPEWDYVDDEISHFIGKDVCLRCGAKGIGAHLKRCSAPANEII